MPDWIIFLEYFPIGGLASLWSRGFTIFKIGYRNNCYQIAKRQIHVKIKKRGQSVPVLKKYLEKFDIKP